MAMQVSPKKFIPLIMLCWILLSVGGRAAEDQLFSIPPDILSKDEKVIATAMNPDPDKYPTLHCRLHTRTIAFITITFPNVPGSRVDGCTYETTDPNNPIDFIGLRLPGDNRIELRHRYSEYPQVYLLTTFTAEPGAVTVESRLELDPEWKGTTPQLPSNLAWPNLCLSLMKSPNFTPGGDPKAPDLTTKNNYYNWIGRSFIFTEEGQTFLDKTRRVKTPEVPDTDERNSPPLYAWSQHYVGVWDPPTTPPFPHNTCLDRYMIPLIGAVSNDGKYIIALGSDWTDYIAQAWGFCYHHITPWMPKDAPLLARSMRIKLYGMDNQPDVLLNIVKQDFPNAATRLGNTISDSAVVPDPMPQGRIEYINPVIPAFKTPEYSGKRYEALVPSTLDLAERCSLAINYLTETLNPNCGYIPYSFVDHLADPPAMYQHNQGIMIFGKFLQPLPLLRVASGSKQNLDIETEMLKVLLHMQGPDGLIYWSISGRPWEKWTWDTSTEGLENAQIAHLDGFGNGRNLSALCYYARKDPAGPWREAARRLAEGFKRSLIGEGDVAYRFAKCKVVDQPITRPQEKPLGQSALENAWMALGLVRYDQAFGDPESLELAHKMIRYIMRDGQCFAEDGRFIDAPPSEWAHFHTHTMAMLAALCVSERTGDKYLLDRALKAYEYGIRAGEGTLGYFPEAVHVSGPEPTGTHGYGYLTSENCEVADMVSVGIMLSRLGIDKWDDVDRWVRNQFSENQLTWTGWITDGHVDLSQRKIPKERIEMFQKSGWYTTDRVIPRTIGGFSGWPGPNDWVGHPNTPHIGLTIMNCCCGNGSRTLYHVWRNILNYESGTLKVNLLFNRASKWADVDSYIPFEGRVDIKAKQNLDLDVRIPDWTSQENVKCTVDGKEQSVQFSGRYAQIGGIKEGQTVSLNFPISEKTVTVKVQDEPNHHGSPYTLVLRGNDVVSIEPPGRYCPFYQRGHFRTGTPLYKKVERFVSDEDYDSSWF